MTHSDMVGSHGLSTSCRTTFLAPPSCCWRPIEKTDLIVIAGVAPLTKKSEDSGYDISKESIRFWGEELRDEPKNGCGTQLGFLWYSFRSTSAFSAPSWIIYLAGTKMLNTINLTNCLSSGCLAHSSKVLGFDSCRVRVFSFFFKKRYL